MHDPSIPFVSARFVAPIAGVPDVQARALDRRHRLDRQQRSFRGPARGIAGEGSFGAGPESVISPDGPGRG